MHPSLAKIDDYDWKHIFEEYASSPEPVQGDDAVSLDSFAREDVAEVLASDDGENEGPNWIAVVRLKDGRFAALSAGCDYTGWG